MSAKLSVEEILAHLETQMAHHKQQEEHHAAQEALHREQKEAHAAEYEAIARHYEGFKAAAGSAVEIAIRTGAARRPEVQELAPDEPVLASRLVARVVEGLPDGEVFHASGLAAEVNRRYKKTLRKPVDSRLVSAALRRLAARGVIRLAEPGKPRYEARYSKA